MSWSLAPPNISLNSTVDYVNVSVPFLKKNINNINRGIINVTLFRP